MNKDLKHYLIVGAILCGIGASSALLIGLTDLATSDTIATNNKIQEEKALKSIYYQDNVDFGEKKVIDKNSLSDEEQKTFVNLLCYWDPKEKGSEVDDNTKFGYIFKCEGSDANGYGKVTMLCEVVNEEVGKISIITNTESYAKDVANYVNNYNDKKIQLEDVKCGATYGATLVKEMATAAKDFANKHIDK